MDGGVGREELVAQLRGAVVVPRELLLGIAVGVPGGLVEGFDGVEDNFGSGHTSGPWSGDEIQELEQLAEIVPEVEGE